MKIIEVPFDPFEYGKMRENELYYGEEYEIEDILKSEKLTPYSSALNPFTEKEQEFVWFSYYAFYGIGLIFDLKKLSERYEILQHSEVEKYHKCGIYVHRIVAYSDDTYQMNRQNIDRDIYEIIRNEFAKQPEKVVKEKNIVHSHKGKTKKKDVTVKESFSCNLRDVTLNIPAERFTLKQLYHIIEKGDPIIFLKNDEEYLDVSECISGFYYCTRTEDPDENIINFLIEYLRPLCEKYNKNIMHTEENYFPYTTDYYTLCD